MFALLVGIVLFVTMQINAMGNDGQDALDKSKYDKYDIIRTPFDRKVEEVEAYFKSERKEKTAFDTNISIILDLLYDKNPGNRYSRFSEALHRTCNLLYISIVNDSAEEIRLLTKINELIKFKNPKLDIFCFEINESINMHPLEWARFLRRSIAEKTLKSFGAIAGGYRYIEKKQDLEKLKPVHFAVVTGQFKEALDLVRQGEDFSGFPFDFSGPIIKGYFKGTCVGGMKNLLEYALDFVDYTPDSCLEFLQEIITRGYDINNSTWSYYIWKSLFGRTSNLYNVDKVIKLFLENGADPNLLSFHGCYCATPLYFAIQYYDVKAVRTLLRAYADPNIPSSCGQNMYAPAYTALAYACEGIISPVAEYDAETRAKLQEIRRLLKEYDGKGIIYRRVSLSQVVQDKVAE